MASIRWHRKCAKDQSPTLLNPIHTTIDDITFQYGSFFDRSMVPIGTLSLTIADETSISVQWLYSILGFTLGQLLMDWCPGALLWFTVCVEVPQVPSERAVCLECGPCVRLDWSSTECIGFRWWQRCLYFNCGGLEVGQPSTDYYIIWRFFAYSIKIFSIFLFTAVSSFILPCGGHFVFV